MNQDFVLRQQRRLLNKTASFRQNSDPMPKGRVTGSLQRFSHWITEAIKPVLNCFSEFFLGCETHSAWAVATSFFFSRRIPLPDLCRATTQALYRGHKVKACCLLELFFSDWSPVYSHDLRSFLVTGDFNFLLHSSVLEGTGGVTLPSWACAARGFLNASS